MLVNEKIAYFKEAAINILPKSARKLFISVLASLYASTVFAQSDLSERIEFAGFARFVAGHIDTGDATFEGYDDGVSFSQQSLIAIQSDLTLTDTLSVSGQLLGHTSDKRESGLEWLYLSYTPNKQWQFKFGKLRTPFFKYSDVIDVGYAYPWISPPQQVYSGLLFSNYEGASATYSFNVKDFNLDIESYIGQYSGQFSRAGENVDIDVNEIKGGILTLNYGNLNIRTSVNNSSDYYADFPGFDEFISVLEFSGFNESAEALSFNGETTGYQLSVSYDTLDYFVSAEWAKVDSDLFIVPQLDAYYFMAGYNFYPFQLHLTYASSKSYYKKIENTIPIGISPQIDGLSFAYEQIVGGLPLYSLDSLTLGFRWDFHHNLSVKAEVSLLDGKPNENSYFNDVTNPDFDRKATLSQIAIEWVF